MKKIFYIYLVALVAITCACEEDYMPPEGSANFSEVAYYTSQLHLARESWAINVGDYVTFAAISVNEMNHQWVIPGDDIAYFIQGPLTNTSTIEDKIVNVGDTVTTEKVINVMFAKPGLQAVTLRQTFADSVAFRGNDTIPAIRQEDGTWLYEEQLLVDVYDSIAAKARIFLEDVEIPVTTDQDTIFIEGGQTLKLVDISNGRPNTWRWKVGPLEANDSSSVLPITLGLGVYPIWLTASRTGENVPGNSNTLLIPNPVKVVPSSLPFEINGDIVELEDQTIQIPFSGEFMQFLEDKTSFFTVTVNGTPFEVSTVAINGSDSKILDLKLSESIYRDDVISISLTDGNGLQATDTRSAVLFTEVPVTMFEHNIIDYDEYGFEAGIGGWQGRFDNESHWEISSDQAHSGTFSVKYVRVGNNDEFEKRNTGIENITGFDLKAGVTYEMSYWLYNDQAPTSGMTSPYWLGLWQQFWIDTNLATEDTWVKYTHEFEATSDLTQTLYLRFLIEGTYYYDDIKIRVKDVRPE